jgi:hypothetical protein
MAATTAAASGVIAKRLAVEALDFELRLVIIHSPESAATSMNRSRLLISYLYFPYWSIFLLLLTLTTGHIPDMRSGIPCCIPLIMMSSQDWQHIAKRSNKIPDLQGHTPAGNRNRVVANTDIVERDVHGILIFRYSR